MPAIAKNGMVWAIMLERAILYGLPALCGLALALVLFGPGAQRVVSGARVHGLTVQEATAFAFRVEALDHYDGLLQPSPGELLVEVIAAGRVWGVWRGETDVKGWAEANGALGNPLPRGASVRVTRGTRTLAEGTLAHHDPLEAEPAAHCDASGKIGQAAPPEGWASKITIRTCVVRGVVVPELPERIEITAEYPEADRDSIALDVSAPGADLGARTEDPARAACRFVCRTSWWQNVVVRAPTVSVGVAARAGNAKGEHHSDLPLHAGGIWLAPSWREKRVLELVAATPKPRAHLSLLAERGRIWGASVDMTVDDKGMSSASVPMPEVPQIGREPLTLMVASDPTEPPMRTVAWPLSPSADRIKPAGIALLLDGMPRTIAKEKARMRSARWPIAGMIVASAAAVLSLLFLRSQRAREKLEQHLEAQGGAGAKEAARVPLGLAMVVAAALALAFAIMAGIAAWG